MIRDTEKEAIAFFREQMEANKQSDTIYEQADVHLTAPERMIELMVGWKDLGFETVMVEIASPFDDEAAERFATEIRPQVDRQILTSHNARPVSQAGPLDSARTPPLESAA